MNLGTGLVFLGVILSVVVFGASFSAVDEGGKASAAALGEMLFHDKILSRDLSVSCASCHKPEFAFADTVRFSMGIDGQPGTRNTPSAMNVMMRSVLFWDGRASSLEEHALQPIANPMEMDLSIPEALNRLRDHSEYRLHFLEVYGHLPDSFSLANALAEFQRTLETSDTPWDRYAIHDQPADPAVLRGKAIFDSKGMCLECHFTPDFTADEFKNVGLFDGLEFNDAGRFGITGDSSDLGRFKVPGLRNVAVTAPYMHNGMFGTLDEVLEFYNDTRRFVANPVNQDTLLQEPLGLTVQEMSDVVAFLKALTDDRFAHLLDE